MYVRINQFKTFDICIKYVRFLCIRTPSNYLGNRRQLLLLSKENKIILCSLLKYLPLI